MENKMNTTEKLLSAMLNILAELQKQNGVKPDVDRNSDIPTEPQKRWKPKDSEKYGYIGSDSNWFINTWSDSKYDNYRHDTGNCYQPHEQERAIWEQVTRRKYEAALWEAANWVKGKDGFFGCLVGNSITASYFSNQNFFNNQPRFATRQSAIDAHTRILGDDAERYFKGRF